MEPLLERPGAFVLGSNDYFGPVPKNPARYLTGRYAEVRHSRVDLPVGRLVEGLREGGWADLNNARTVCGWATTTSSWSGSTTRTSGSTATTRCPPRRPMTSP